VLNHRESKKGKLIKMKILAIDIGAKTQDILLYDDSVTPENCIKLVLPSPMVIFKKEVVKVTGDLFVKGDTIAGGMLSRALKEHAKKHRVFMTKTAAYSIKEDINVVRSHGIEIVEDEDVINFERNFSGEVISLKEINFELFKNILENFNEELNIDYVAVAVQDHGAAPKGVSDRKFRFKLFSKILEKSRDLESFAFKNPPEHYFRMNSIMSAIRRQTDVPAIVMDTSPDSVVGCLEDDRVDSKGPTLIVNIGNGHSIFMVISERKVDALMEHHTRCLENDPAKLESLVRRFADGNVTDDEIYNDGGNGAIIIKAPGFSNLKQIVVTGPHRNIFKKTNLCVHYATPAGDMMMTGPMGLVRCVKKIYGLM